jgi:hypothetical protein
MRCGEQKYMWHMHYCCFTRKHGEIFRNISHKQADVIGNTGIGVLIHMRVD